MESSQQPIMATNHKEKNNKPSASRQGQANRRPTEPINLMELCLYMLKHAWAICLAGLIGALLAGLYTYSYITPTYTSSATIYIADMNTLSIQDLQIGSALTVDYTIMANTQNVATGAMTALGIEDQMTYQEFLSMVNVTNPTDSHMLVITATNVDPLMAADIANAMAEQLQNQIATIMDTKKPSTVQKALVPRMPSAPSMKRNMAKGFVFFAGLVCAILCFIYTYKDTISSEKEIERRLGLPVIASIGKGNRDSIYLPAGAIPKRRRSE